ncbi:unnamed protein product [Rotaria socialis]
MWDEVMTVNLLSLMRMTGRCLPMMKECKHSAVIAISSIAATMTNGKLAQYYASKWGLNGFLGSIYEDVREYGIKDCTKMTLELLPNEMLFFQGPFDVVSTAILQLNNIGHQRIAFSIKTTAPKRYCVKPNRDFIEPYGTTSIQIMFQPMPAGQQSEDRSKHKFMVQWTIAPNDYKNDIQDFWKQSSSELKDVNDSKLQCAFINEPTMLLSLKESVLDVIRRAEATAERNNELIRQINEMTGEITVMTYALRRQDNGSYSVEENIRVSIEAQMIVSEWQDIIQLINIEDSFNDEINYSCNDYQDMIFLNSDMLLVIKKYESLGDEDRLLKIVNKFAENFCRIERALQKLLLHLCTSDQSRLDEITQRVDRINNEIKDLRDKYKYLSFV